MSFTTLISSEVLAGILSDPNCVIIDCRFSLKDTSKGASEYALSHIPNARYAHLDRDLSGEIIPGTTGRHPLPDVDGFATQLGHWGIGPDTQVVAYDDMGSPYASRLWAMLKWLGHDAVAVLDGGWTKWIAEGRATENTVPIVTKKTFPAALNTQLIVSTSEVELATTQDHISLIDARAAERFAGRHEPIDPIAGHIPSALSYPWQENLDTASGEHKCFLSEEQLRQRFAEVETKDAILYCGSGVTAAHNLLAIAHAGLPLPRLYAGSWSEWITSPEREIA